MEMHGPYTSFTALLFVMKSVMGERGHSCQASLICAFPAAPTTLPKDSVSAPYLAVHLTGQYGPVWRLSGSPAPVSLRAGADSQYNYKYKKICYHLKY